MAQSFLDIIFRTKKEGTGASGVTKELGEMKKGLLGAVENMTGLSIASMGTAAAIAGVGKFMADSVKSTMEYAAQVRDLARVSGASADETSRLIQTADDLDVSYETLTSAAKKLAKEGIALTTEELAKASDEYLKITDAGGRAEYAVTKFGKAGLEMTKILEQGGDAIRAMAKEQEGGLILTDEQVRQARELEKANDALGDTWRALTTELGMGLIPELVKLVTWLNNVATAGKKTQNQVKDITTTTATGAASYEEYRAAMIRQVEAAGLVVGKYDEIRYKGGQLVDGARMLTEEQWKQQKAFAQNAKDIQTYGQNAQWSSEQGVAPLTTSTSDLTKAQQEEKLAMDTVMGSMKALTLEMLYQRAAAVLDSDAALALGRSMGVIDEKTYGALDQLNQLKKDLATGKITVDEYSQSVRDLGGYIGGLHSKTITIDVITKHKLIDDYDPVKDKPGPTYYDPKKDPTLPENNPVVIDTGSVSNITPVNIYVQGSPDPEVTARAVAQVLRNRR